MYHSRTVGGGLTNIIKLITNNLKPQNYESERNERDSI